MLNQYIDLPTQWKVLRKIGRGMYSTVYMVEEINTCNIYALKVMKYMKDVNLFINESKIFTLLDYPTIPKYFKTVHLKYTSFYNDNIIETYDKVPLNDTITIDSKNNEYENCCYLMAIVMEYCQGMSLNRFVELYGYLSGDILQSVVIQLANTLAYLKKKNILHRDIKPDNILIDEKNNIKLIDFGFGTITTENTLIRDAGTPYYMAPESFNHHHIFASDVWSMGITLFYAATGELTFQAEDRTELIENISKLKYYIPYFIPNDLTFLFIDIFVLDPDDRIDIDEIVHHRYLKNSPRLIKSHS